MHARVQQELNVEFTAQLPNGKQSLEQLLTPMVALYHFGTLITMVLLVSTISLLSEAGLHLT
jgi:hypothetical protein